MVAMIVLNAQRIKKFFIFSHGTCAAVGKKPGSLRIFAQAKAKAQAQFALGAGYGFDHFAADLLAVAFKQIIR